MMTKGELSRFVAVGVCGVTANPATMARAITSGSDYDADIRHPAATGRSTSEIYDALLTSDVRRACDILRPVYEERQGEDGFVSLEVSPKLADDTSGSIAEAKRFWTTVDRPNLFAAERCPFAPALRPRGAGQAKPEAKAAAAPKPYAGFHHDNGRGGADIAPMSGLATIAGGESRWYR